jgi:hypothetical protein
MQIPMSCAPGANTDLEIVKARFHSRTRVRKVSFASIREQDIIRIIGIYQLQEYRHTGIQEYTYYRNILIAK